MKGKRASLSRVTGRCAPVKEHRRASQDAPAGPSVQARDAKGAAAPPPAVVRDRGGGRGPGRHDRRHVNLLAIPFNRHLGLERSGKPGCLFSLPAKPCYTNHLGTVHAGALLALAEASSGEFMAREFGDLAAGVVPVVRRVEAKFRRPARGAVHARGRVEEPVRKAFLNSLAEKGRATIEVHVDLIDDDEVPLVLARVEWFVARADPGEAAVGSGA